MLTPPIPRRIVLYGCRDAVQNGSRTDASIQVLTSSPSNLFSHTEALAAQPLILPHPSVLPRLCMILQGTQLFRRPLNHFTGFSIISLTPQSFRRLLNHFAGPSSISPAPQSFASPSITSPAPQIISRLPNHFAGSRGPGSGECRATLRLTPPDVGDP